MTMHHRYSSGRRCAGLTGIMLAFGLAVSSAHAVVDYTLTVEGVTSGRINALSFGHAVTNSRTGVCVHADLQVTKAVDRVSPLLMSALYSTQHLALVRVEARETTAAAVRYYAMRMKDVLVSSYSTTGSNSDDTPTEQVSLNYSEIEWTAIQTDPAGLPGYAQSDFFSLLTSQGGVSDPDSDGDGIPDSYEAAELLKPLLDDANEDSDGDKMSNLNEYLSGTSARDPASVFCFTGITRLTAAGTSECTVTFNSVPGRTYDLYASAWLTDLPMLEKTVIATQPQTSVVLTLQGDQMFVRVTVRAP